MPTARDCRLAYSIEDDDYFLYANGRRMLLRGLVSPINGLLDARKLDDLPDYEKKWVEDLPKKEHVDTENVGSSEEDCGGSLP